MAYVYRVLYKQCFQAATWKSVYESTSLSESSVFHHIKQENWKKNIWIFEGFSIPLALERDNQFEPNGSLFTPPQI